MKQIDHIDSLKHFNFPYSEKGKRDKFGSLLLTVVGVLGLFALSSPNFQYSKSDINKSEKVNKFWLTPSTLNAEQTALNSNLIQSSKAGQQLLVSANTAVAKTLN